MVESEVVVVATTAPLAVLPWFVSPLVLLLSGCGSSLGVIGLVGVVGLLLGSMTPETTLMITLLA